MTKQTRQFVLATSTLVGTIIGVGIFGVPYAISRVGVVPALAFFVVLGGIQLLQHLFFAEAAMACPEKKRLPGLVGQYLGNGYRRLAAVVNIGGLWIGMTAYIIVGGEFLSILLKPLVGGEVYQYQMAWAAVGGLLLYFGLAAVSKLGFVTVAALVVSFVLITVRTLPSVRAVNLDLFNVQDILLPYGVLLFSLGGLPAILEMEDILEGRHERFRTAIVIGSLVATALTAAFGFLVYGVTGAATTEDAVTGLKVALGGNIATLAALFGFLAILNCFLRIGTNLKNTFMYDYRLRRLTAWLLAAGVPFAVYLVGSKSFISMISFSGAVFGGITAVLVAALYVAVTKRGIGKERPLGLSPRWAYLSAAILAVGVLYQLVRSASSLWR
jgi:tyrosine-specific transport protein